MSIADIIEPTPAVQEELKNRSNWRTHYKIHVSYGDVGEKFQCARCRRYLPWDRFFVRKHQHLPYKWGKNSRKSIELDGICTTCRKQLKSAWIDHPAYTPSLHRFWSDQVTQQRAGARLRKLPFLIDKEDVLGLYLSQDCRCAYSGVELDPWGKKNKGKILKPSIDRINSRFGYELNNIQIVSAAVNIMKGELSHNEFIRVCAHIVDRQMKKRDALLAEIKDLEGDDQ